MVLEIREKSGKKYTVTCDGERYCRCYPGDLRELGFAEFTEGQTVEISEQSLAELEKTVFLTRAKRRSLFLLGKKEYTSREMVKKLADDGYPEQVTASVLAWLYELHYVDDGSYAERYALYLLPRCSERELIQKMYQKGFEKVVIREALEQAKVRYREENSSNEEETVSPEEEAIRAFLRKKGYRTETTDEEKKKKLVASLYRKGFSLDKIQAVMGAVDTEYPE